MDRATKFDLDKSVDLLNYLLGERGSAFRVEIGYRYGYTAIDLAYADGRGIRETYRTGLTKTSARAIIVAMIYGIDLSGRKE